MGQYDRYIGDVEDYTDEEVYEFSVSGVARERIIRLRLAWRWCMVRRDAGMLPGEAAVVGMLAGGNRRAGVLRTLAEELYTLVTVPKDGETVVQLGPWRVDDIAQLEIEGERKRKKAADRAGDLLASHPLSGLCTLYHKESSALLRDCATMTKAIPRYNHLVQKSSFPSAMWDRGTKKLLNQVMYRLEKEVEAWDKCLTRLKEGQ